MVPVIVGAAVVGAGAVLLSGDEPENTEPEHTRQRVSEDTVQRAMARSGRKIHTVSEAPHDAEIFERVIPEAILAKFGGADSKVDITDEIETELGYRL